MREREREREKEGARGGGEVWEAHRVMRCGRRVRERTSGRMDER